MKTLFKYATVVLLLAGTSACSQPSKRASIIDENIAVAEKQIGMLADSSETGGVIRIPSTWKNGRIDYVPVDDWVSGFFAGTLWYMYELTATRHGPRAHGSIPRSSIRCSTCNGITTWASWSTTATATDCG